MMDLQEKIFKPNQQNKVKLLWTNMYQMSRLGPSSQENSWLFGI